MIKHINSFRVYAALSYTPDQLDNMQWSLRGIFPRDLMDELCELTKQPINGDWEKKTEAVIKYNTRIEIGNIIKDIGCRNIPFICMRDLQK